MSRPGPVIGVSGPEAFRPDPSSDAAASSAPLRVTAERLTVAEARAAERAEAERRQTWVRTTAPATTTMTPVAPPGMSAPPGTVAPPAGAAVAPVSAPGLPVPLGLPPRRSGLAELLALITGQRRTGRHRPDCVRRQGWTMFSPGRRQRRRGRFRSRV